MPKRIYRLLVTVKITSMHLSYWLNYLFGIPGMGYDFSSNNICAISYFQERNKQERNIIANVAFELIRCIQQVVLAVFFPFFFNQSTGSFHGAKSHRPSFLQPVLVALQGHSLLVRFLSRH